MGLLAGKKGLVLNIANDRSIATYIAANAIKEGATCGFGFLPMDNAEKSQRRVRKRCRVRRPRWLLGWAKWPQVAVEGASSPERRRPPWVSQAAWSSATCSRMPLVGMTPKPEKQAKRSRSKRQPMTWEMVEPISASTRRLRRSEPNPEAC